MLLFLWAGNLISTNFSRDTIFRKGMVDILNRNFMPLKDQACLLGLAFPKYEIFV